MELIRSYWMMTRPELIHLPRVRAAWDFLKGLMRREQDVLMGRVSRSLLVTGESGLW